MELVRSVGGFRIQCGASRDGFAARAVAGVGAARLAARTRGLALKVGKALPKPQGFPEAVALAPPGVFDQTPAASRAGCGQVSVRQRVDQRLPVPRVTEDAGHAVEVRPCGPGLPGQPHIDDIELLAERDHGSSPSVKRITLGGVARLSAGLAERGVEDRVQLIPLRRRPGFRCEGSPVSGEGPCPFGEIGRGAGSLDQGQCAQAGFPLQGGNAGAGQIDDDPVISGCAEVSSKAREIPARRRGPGGAQSFGHPEYGAGAFDPDSCCAQIGGDGLVGEDQTAQQDPLQAGPQCLVLPHAWQISASGVYASHARIIRPSASSVNAPRLGRRFESFVDAGWALWWLGSMRRNEILGNGDTAPLALGPRSRFAARVRGVVGARGQFCHGTWVYWVSCDREVGSVARVAFVGCGQETGGALRTSRILRRT